MTLTNPLEMRRCHAHNRQGGQCGLTSIPGARVCRMHGGLSPQVQLAALERLKRLQPRAVDVIAEIMDEPGPFRLAAARDVLDRTGVGKDKVSIEAAVAFTLRIDRGDSDD